MITIRRLLILCIFSLLCFYAAYAAANVDDMPEMTSVRYNGQTTFSCEGNTFPIPPYMPYMHKWPYTDNEFYMTALKERCSPQAFDMTIGLTPTCIGQNVCGRASFFYNKLDGLLEEKLEGYFSAYGQDIKLHKNLFGYFVPSRCFAYCNEARLVWFKDNAIYVIGVHHNNSDETKKELIESANSYIDAEGKR